MELEKNIKQQLAELLESPGRVTQQHAFMLTALLKEYPYYQPLHLLLARANAGLPENPALARAALYTNGQLLHGFLQDHQPAGQVFTQLVSGDTRTAHAPEPAAETDQAGYRPFRNGEFNTGLPAEAAAEPAAEDTLVLESIVSADFFAFQESRDAAAVQETAPELQAAAPLAAPAAPGTAQGQVSNYDDETLPYTFLWWLAKTRKEHQRIFQPYAQPRKAGAPELQQQYVEHIFHTQSPLSGAGLQPDGQEQKPAGRDAELIESFIRRDPQINPPQAEQIDNENKARRSAEDQNDLVSETLAGIYIEQMLYDKAIDTYEKLSLKFPEKRRYFADLIQSIQKKI